MGVSRWRKWASYWREICLETAESELNGRLEVALSNGKLILYTPNAIYSFDDLYVNFLHSFHQLKIERHAGRDVLLLGLGLGSVPYMLEKNFNCSYRYTAVELDPEVIRLAKRYSLPRLQSAVECRCMDALQYVFHEAPSREFDMVVMDIFVDAEVPAEFEDVSFLEALAATLRPNGLLLYNRLYRSVGDRALTDYYFEGVFKVVFPEAYYVETEGNRVLIGRA